MTKHIALLGDSIFDNKTYVGDEKSVHEHLCELLPDADRATLLAVDGAVTSSVHRQVERIPADATDLVLSVGGNDAIYLESNLFGQDSGDIRDALAKMMVSLAGFQNEYRELIESLLQRHLPLRVCTIYDSIPNLDDTGRCGLAVINDIITRTAFEFGLDLIDLRLLCDEASDYAEVSPIEPSHDGGRKIAGCILHSLESSDPSSQVFSQS